MKKAEYTPEFKAAFLKAITKGTEYEKAPFLFICTDCGCPNTMVEIEDRGPEKPPAFTYTCPDCGNSATWVPIEYGQEQPAPDESELLEKIENILFSTMEGEAQEALKRLRELFSEYEEDEEEPETTTEIIFTTTGEEAEKNFRELQKHIIDEYGGEISTDPEDIEAFYNELLDFETAPDPDDNPLEY